MFKLVVLSALLAVAAAKPGYLTGEHTLAYSAPAVTYETHEIETLPAATSHQYRTDVISKPVVATYETAPIIQKTIVAEPAIAYSAPIVQNTVAYAAPAVHHLGYAAHAAPLAYAGHSGLAYAGHGALAYAGHGGLAYAGHNGLAYAGHGASLAYAGHAAPLGYSGHYAGHYGHYL